ncbi:MAG: ABC transporter ATP-binding protein [Verrucomicrobiales bacterium]|nr:ABC transporter ATP-binding protein [Verrucomicrobiales bacterium]
MPKKKKVSRKDFANLSNKEAMALAGQTYRKLYAYMKPYRWRFIGGQFLGILAGLTNVLLIQGMKIIFDVVLQQGGDVEEKAESFKLGFGKVSFNPTDWFPPEWIGSYQLVIAACILVPMVFLLRGGFTYLANYMLMWVGNRILLDLRNDTYQALLRQSMSFYSTSRVGQMVQTVFNQSRVAQQNLVTLSQDIIQRPVSILAILAALIHMNPWFTFYSLVVFPLCILPVVYIGKKVRKAGAQEEQEAGMMMVQMTECFQGIRVVKSHAREDFEMKRFQASNLKTNKLIMRYQKALELVGMLVEFVASLGVGVGLFYAWKTHIDSGTFMTLVGGLTQIYPHTKALSRIQLVTQKTIVATSNVFAVMDEEPEVQDAPDAVELRNATGHISFKDVDFSYKTGKSGQRAAVNGINLEMQPGKFYALVGPTGAGKSTLFSLIQRFYDVDAGSVQIDGIDVRQLTQTSLRDHIGVVSQDTFLFHDTIRENIRYGRLDATEAEIIEAAHRAHVDDFVQEKKDGYDTVVGDGGGNLSGGQKQRVTIARAILRNAPILLLDEATSALDTETERIIQDAINNLSEGKTVIAIAHRLSTILEADQIIVMENGRVHSAGTHQELLETSPLYQKLYHLQFKDMVEPAAAV